MKIGAMNDPSKDTCKEIEFIAKNFDFLDLTIEPENAYSESIDVNKILTFKKKYRLEIIGHTPWNLPIASPYATVRKAAYDEFMKCLEIFKKLKVSLVNVHPAIPNDTGDPDKILGYNIDFLKKITKKAKTYDIRIMMENTKLLFNELEVIALVLEKVPTLFLHWDIGHANLGNEGEKKTKTAFLNFKDKIMHLHISDNNGQEDLHLPLGAGNLNWKYVAKILKEFNYNRTVTLEIHSPDRSYLTLSRDKFKNYLKMVD